MPGQTLGEIWQIADQENRGFLTPAGFAVCLRLIGKYQNGEEPDAKLAFQPGPLPKFQGLSIAPPPAPAPSIQPQMSGSGPIRVPPLSPEKATDYAGLFERSGAVDGIMAGDKAKDIFEKARLPNEILGRIWNLADTEQRGALNAEEFVVAMHLLASYRSRTMTGIPATLPSGLWQAAARRVSSAQSPIAPPPGSGIPRQFSGAGGPIRTSSPLARSAFGSPSPTQQSNWVVSPSEKQQYDVLFNKVDINRQGHITGDQAVSFFSESGLSEDHLAQIWDLSDINSEGHLNREEFALAMYLIRMQRGKTQSVLPETLPPNFIPPSMRGQARPPAHSTAPAFDSAPVSSAPKSHSEDLFGLDALTTAPAPRQAQQPTGGSVGATRAGDPFGSQPGSPASPQRADLTGQQQQSAFNPAASTNSFKPFVPSSGFGRSLQTQNTGASTGSAGSASRGLPQPAAMDDLLGDNDPEVSKKLTSETAELANMSNQIGTLRTQMQEVQQKKTATESDLSRTSTQKRDLEMRLSQFRQQYENEIRTVKELEQKLATSKTDSEKLRQEYASLESSFRELQSQHQQVAQALAADQQENAVLRQKISETNNHISQLKPQLEKARADARLEKGKVAINKKQLVTNEGERDRLDNDLVEANKELEEAKAASAVPAAAAVASPALSTASQSTNPFFRRSPPPATENVMSPGNLSRQVTDVGGPSKTAQEDFDSFFQTSSFTSPQTTGPPPTTFRSSDPEPAQTSSLKSSEADFPSTSFPEPALPQDPAHQPPPPPHSRQITSNQLPLQPPTAGPESIASSVQVNTPASGGNGMLTPTPGGLERTEAGEPDALDRGLTASPAVAAGIPGAFPDPSPVVQRAATSDSKHDFDSAFAKYSPQRSATGTPVNGAQAAEPGPTKLNQEFPPIQDVESDEDDSSDDERGFDDNFGSPGQSKKIEPAEEPQSHEPESSTAHDDDLYAAPRPQVQQTASSVSALPAADAQKSPPTYGETMTEHASKDSASFPPEFGGLLPSREDPTHGEVQPEQTLPATLSPQESHEPSGTTVPVISNLPAAINTADTEVTPVQHDSAASTAGSDAFHDATDFPSVQNGAAPATTHIQHAKAPTDDFDDGFDDLDEAKEHADEVDEDDFVHTSRHQEGFDDFNPTFDSPAASRPTTLASANPTPSGSRTINQPPQDSFADFDQEIESAFNTSSPTAAKAPAQGSSSATNWDDLFSNMDKEPPNTKLDATGGFPSFNASSTAAAATNGSDPFDVPPPPGPPPSKSKANMPPLDRTLTTEHDDPILKGLTSKGFARSDALQALEKYDYDSTKALEHLSVPHITQLTNMGYKKEDAVKALKAYDYDLNKVGLDINHTTHAGKLLTVPQAANYLTSSG